MDNKDINKRVSDQLNEIIRRVNERFEGKTYTDEPIIIRASQMKNYTPPEITQMRKFARDNYAKMGDYRLFVMQAKSMQDFTDDFEYEGDFFCYYPTYQSMTDRQLRGYFTWRTKVRNGIIERTSPSYAFVYIYELLNMIGAGSAQDAYDKLKAFVDAYGALDGSICSYAKLWKRDFIVYHGLNPEYIERSNDIDFENAVYYLVNFRDYSPQKLLETLDSLSPYSIRKSRFGRTYPKETEKIVYGVFGALTGYYGKHRGKSLCESLFGTMYKSGYNMFNSAVFFDDKPHADTVYRVNDYCIYTCKNDTWYCSRLFKDNGKSKRLGVMMKSIDYILREKYGMKSQLKNVKVTQFVRKLTEDEIEKSEKEKKKLAVPKITIDTSRLKAIRELSDKTADRLIVEEEREDELVEEIVHIPESDSILNEAELLFVQKLLCNEPYADAVRQSGKLLSVLCEDINEKLFDSIGDNVIEFIDDAPSVIEDYTPELRGILKL